MQLFKILLNFKNPLKLFSLFSPKLYVKQIMESIQNKYFVRYKLLSSFVLSHGDVFQKQLLFFNIFLLLIPILFNKKIFLDLFIL